MTIQKMTDKKTQLLRQLPHRYPMRLVDRLLELQIDYIKALKNVTLNEPFFPGHFPGMPVMPGVLIIEALAQASALLVVNKFNVAGKEVAAKEGLCLLVGVDKARFRQQVLPGDRLILESRYGRAKGNYFTFDTVASVEGEVVATAQIRSMFKVE